MIERAIFTALVLVMIAVVAVLTMMALERIQSDRSVPDRSGRIWV